MKTFTSYTETDNNTIMIVDALNLAFRYKHSKAKVFSADYIKTVNSLAKSYKAAKVIIACDQGSSSYRKAILPEYKQHRKEKYDQQTEQEARDFEEFFQEFNRTMEDISKIYPLLRFDKCEADDIAAFIVNQYNTRNIWLISSDADWDLLIRDNVSRFSYVSRKEITKENWNTHYDFSIDDLISIKCLTGDSGDNVPGIPGVAAVRAKTLVERYGTAYDIAASLPISSKYKYIQSLNDFGSDNLLRNYRLMDLVSYCDEALGKDNCDKIEEILEGYLND